MEDITQLSFGGIKSPEDYRKIQLSDILGEAGPMPTEFFVDITSLPRWHQRMLGACTAHASGKKKQESDYSQTSVVPGLSPRFIYALSKAHDGVPLLPDGQPNQGTSYDMPFKILQKYGVCTEELLPNDTTLSYADYVDLTKITPAAYSEALAHKIIGYAEVKLDETSLKQAIVQCNGLVLGLQVGKEWYTSYNGTPSWSAEDILPLRPPVNVLSGHDVYLYGWDTVSGKTRFWILNSWSSEWGLNGTGNFIYEDYAAFLQEAVTIADVPDAWILALKSSPPANQFKHDFTTNLVFGEAGDEVLALQNALKIDGEFPQSMQEVPHYGPMTQAAVLKFQLKYGVAETIELEKLNGKLVGPSTRVALNNLFNK